jgi:hypothetical protein
MSHEEERCSGLVSHVWGERKQDSHTTASCRHVFIVTKVPVDLVWLLALVMSHYKGSRPQNPGGQRPGWVSQHRRPGLGFVLSEHHLKSP